MSTSNINVIKKPKRDFTKKVLSVRMNPPSMHEGETTDKPELKASYVTQTGKLQRFPCTQAVFRRIEGRPKPNKPHPGLDTRSNMDFIIGIKGGVVTSVDTMPKIKKLLHNVNRVDENRPDTVQLTIDGNGQVDIQAVPEEVTTRGLVKLISLIDAEEEIQPGMTLGGRHEVLSVAGNRVEVDFVGVEAPAE